MIRATSMMPMLSVADLGKALAFYEETLGGERVFQFPDEGEPVFLTLAFGMTEIGLGKAGGEPMHGRAQRPAQGHRMELCIYVDDVDGAFDALAAIGAAGVVEPTDQPWGERVAYVEDPDGNLVMLAAATG